MLTQLAILHTCKSEFKGTKPSCEKHAYIEKYYSKFIFTDTIRNMQDLSIHYLLMHQVFNLQYDILVTCTLLPVTFKNVSSAV